MYAPVPPVVLTLAVPLFAPQVAAVDDGVGLITTGAVMVILVVLWHPPASVIVTV